MALEPGTHLGPYEVSGPLGAGGMGEVYRARDTKLGRDVAIKTLPAALAGDKERLARFEREAQLLAALNHAHIASVYGLDVHDGTLYLAMELVEGETLEEKLKAGALPVEDALRLALQVAEALEAAHGKGVVHRDLKPANIMVTRDGQVKVLDFGLAKAFAGDPNEGTPANSPALSVAMTQQGLVLGTAGYMAPEQASGQATDQRADIWAFGVVLYEMLSGLPLFSGESVPHILADVLKTEPDWRRLPKNLHPRLKLLLERCLTKRPRDRLHSIADARVEIESVLGAPEGVTPASAVTAIPKRGHTARLIGVAAGAAVIAGAAVWFLRPAPAVEASPVVRFSVPLPDGQSFSANAASMIAVSPDGTRIAYVANGQIFVRNLAEPDARPVQGTDEGPLTAATPAFSPDGQWLVYVHVAGTTGPYTVKRVPISGGAPVTIHESSAPNYPRGLTWPTPDSILFTDEDGVVRMPANGGATEVLVPRGEDERFDSPQLLPGGDAVLFTRVAGPIGAAGGYDTAQVVVQSIGKDDRTVVWDGGSAARYLSTGHLVYAQGTALFGIRFDPATRAVMGGPVPMLEGLRRSVNARDGTANFAVSGTGTLAMIPGDGGGAGADRPKTTLTWVDTSGHEEALPVRPDDYTMARISPDGTKIALVVGAALVRDTKPAVWIYDERTENLSLLTGDPKGDDGPVWSSDSRRVYFRSARGDLSGVYSIELETGETTLVASSPDHPFALPWTIAPDDGVLGLVDASSTAEVALSTLSLADGKITPLLHEDPADSEPSISPNGAWIAYAASASPGDANAEIDVRPFPGVARTRIPVGRGETPVFSRDGSELLFVAGDSLMAAPVTYEPTLRVGMPRRVFESSAYQWAFLGRAWDVDPSGKRFLMIRRPGADQAPGRQTNDRIDVVLNWSEELKQRAPAE